MIHELRSSEAERQHVATFLRDSCVDGRLEPDELDERLDRALRSRTYGDLVELVVDLPGGRASLPAGPTLAPVRAQPRRTPKALPVALAAMVALVVLPSFLPVPGLLLLTFGALALAMLGSVLLVALAPFLAVGALVVAVVDRLLGRDAARARHRATS
ncbi:MAG: DUF1707 domain-containing protein [Solirubrobacterales bacterium]|nr:DUF1707 domain-containing protein [Solirubrobacterales bacterium]